MIEVLKTPRTRAAALALAIGLGITGCASAEGVKPGPDQPTAPAATQGPTQGPGVVRVVQCAAEQPNTWPLMSTAPLPFNIDDIARVLNVAPQLVEDGKAGKVTCEHPIKSEWVGNGSSVIATVSGLGGMALSPRCKVIGMEEISTSSAEPTPDASGNIHIQSSIVVVTCPAIEQLPSESAVSTSMALGASAQPVAAI